MIRFSFDGNNFYGRFVDRSHVQLIENLKKLIQFAFLRNPYFFDFPKRNPYASPKRQPIGMFNNQVIIVNPNPLFS